MMKCHVPDLLAHEYLTSHWGTESFSVWLGRAGRAGRREVTLLQCPGNNGVFFPGSLLHPHH